MVDHGCDAIKARVQANSKPNELRRWEVWVAQPDAMYAETGRFVRACDEEEAASEAVRMLLAEGEQPLRSLGGVAVPPRFVVCIIEAGGPLQEGTGCMFLAHQYSVAVDANGPYSGESAENETLSGLAPKLLECGFVHLPEEGGLAFYEYFEHPLLASSSAISL